MIALGIDPDLHTTGIALVERLGEGDCRLLWTATARVGPEFKRRDAVAPMAVCIQGCLKNRPSGGCDRVVVEAQSAYLGNSSTPPADLLVLAQITGVAISVAVEHILYEVYDRVLVPRPSEWKGNVPKKIHHARLRGKIVGFERDSLKLYRQQNAPFVQTDEFARSAAALTNATRR